MLTSIFLGAFFGFALYYVGTNNNSNILNMLRLRNLTIGKIIFFAIGFAAVLTGLSAQFGLLDISHFSVKGMHLGVILGALIFGIGFGLVGRCPGTCPVAISGGYLKRGLWTLLGGLMGAFAYSLSYGKLEETGLFKLLDWGKLSLFYLNPETPSVFKISYLGLVVMGLLFMLAAYLMPTTVRGQKAKG